MGAMAATTCECLCCERELPALVAAWCERVQPVLTRGVNTGRAIDQTKLQLSAKLVAGIKSGDAASFDERYRDLSHHLPDCHLACPPERVALALLS